MQMVLRAEAMIQSGSVPHRMHKRLLASHVSLHKHRSSQKYGKFVILWAVQVQAGTDPQFQANLRSTWLRAPVPYAVHASQLCLPGTMVLTSENLVKTVEIARCPWGSGLETVHGSICVSHKHIYTKTKPCSGFWTSGQLFLRQGWNFTH